jgi:hypothetical protein
MHILGHLLNALAAQARARAYPKRQVSHQGPLRRLYMGLLRQARKARCRARHQGCHGQRSRCVRCSYSDRNIARAKSARIVS